MAVLSPSNPRVLRARRLIVAHTTSMRANTQAPPPAAAELAGGNVLHCELGSTGTVAADSSGRGHGGVVADGTWEM